MNDRRESGAYDDGRADALAEVEDLRELLRETHGAIKDMERLLREMREAIRGGTAAARLAAHEAAVAEMGRFQEHVQRELDLSAKGLNKAVQRARSQIIDQLTVKHAESIPGGGTRITFAGNLFDDGGVT